MNCYSKTSNLHCLYPLMKYFSSDLTDLLFHHWVFYTSVVTIIMILFPTPADIADMKKN